MLDSRFLAKKCHIFMLNSCLLVVISVSILGGGGQGTNNYSTVWYILYGSIVLLYMQGYIILVVLIRDKKDVF